MGGDRRRFGGRRMGQNRLVYNKYVDYVKGCKTCLISSCIVQFLLVSNSSLIVCTTYTDTYNTLSGLKK